MFSEPDTPHIQCQYYGYSEMALHAIQLKGLKQENTIFAAGKMT